MKRFLIVLAIMAFGINAIAGTGTPGKTVKTDAGTKISVQACDNGIFRIKVSPRKDFGESLMERYGCINGLK